MHPFRQVDVFGSEPLRGNPLAVVHDAEHLETEQMQLFAQWTNLSETVFLLTPGSPDADYRVRIFTPSLELPFAGHPTLGSAHAWLEAGGTPRSDDVVVQECAAGLVPIRTGERLAFRAPPLMRSGPVDPDHRARVLAALGVELDRVVDLAWIDNGPGWVGVLLAHAEDVLALNPDPAALRGLDIGVLGPWVDRPAKADVEVRAFTSDGGEDPVTGSLNAGFGQWLAGTRLPTSYVAAQGAVLHRRGRVEVSRDESGEVWVGGGTVTVLVGQAHL